jgi:hypothetical protein
MNDKIQVTLTRTQAIILRSLLLDASAENMQIAGVEANKPHGSESWKEANANWFRKRSHTARVIASKLSKVSKDKRRKYLDLSTETLPTSI